MCQIFSAFGRRSPVFFGALLIGAALGSVEKARGAITMQETVEPIDSSLEAEGWMGIKLSLVADAASDKVSVMDLKNNVVQNWNPLTGITTWVFPVGDPIGISGPVYQTWTQNKKGQVGATPTGSFDASTYDGTGTDSFFLNSSFDETLDAFTENNDFSISPTEGVSSLMTVSGGNKGSDQVSSMDIAFLIIPAGGNNVTLRGMVADSKSFLFGLDEILNPATFSGSSSFQAFAIGSAPEPGTLSLGAAMGVSMLVRRRKVVR